MIKLAKAGISGDILRLTNDYLSGRKIRFDINEFTTEWMETNVGTPQGSNLSTIFTNVYTSENEEGEPNHGEFSDDNIKWESDKHEWVARDKLQSRIDTFSKWCSENNIEVTKLKTKVLIFRNKKCPRPYNKISLTLNGEEIDEVDSAKILGTILDNQLKFDMHFDKVVKAGYRCRDY